MEGGSHNYTVLLGHASVFRILAFVGANKSSRESRTICVTDLAHVRTIFVGGRENREFHVCPVPVSVGHDRLIGSSREVSER